MPPKVPPSARRNIKHVTFSPFVSCSRLRQVQALLCDHGRQVPDKPDSVLCILGIDSRYNEGSRELANYLLFKFFDTRQAEIESSGFAEETIDDLMFLITKDSVHVYCNPTNYHYLLPYVAHWPGIRFHCMTETEYEDDEAAEEFKIVSFIDMVRDCATVGIPYSAQGHPRPFNPMSVEKWPVVQAYGLEGYATGGFFTMKHEVVDMSDSLGPIYNTVDPVNLETLVTEQLPLFERQWSSMLTNIDVSYKNNGFPTLLEGMVGEPLLSYYSHGRVSKGNQDSSSCRKPFVLFGQNSMRAEIDKTQEGTYRPAKTLQVSGIDGTPARHMTCQMVAPRSPLSCARTYFTSCGHAPYPTTGGTPQAPRPPRTDIEMLEKLYKVVTSAVLASIEEYSKSVSPTKAEQACLETLQTGFGEYNLKFGSAFLKNGANIDFKLESLSYDGQSKALTDQKHSLVKLASLTVYDIPSVEHPGSWVGSVVFAESFIESGVRVQNEDGSLEQNTDYLILTSHLPRSMTWQMDCKKADIENGISVYSKNPEGPFGKLLLNGETCTMVGSHELSVPCEGLIYVFEKGIIFHHPRVGLTVLPKSYYEELQFYDGGSSSVVACLVITYRHSLQYYQPLQNHNEGDMIMFAFAPKTTAYKMLYKQVLSRWQEEGESPTLKQTEAMPEYYSATHKELQYRFDTDTKAQREVAPLAQASIYLPTLKSFLNHLAVSNVDPAPIPQGDVQYLLDQTKGQQEPSGKEEVVITIITGIPGSHKETLCTTLTNMAKDYNRWAVLRTPFGTSDQFSSKQLQTSLSNIVTAARRQRASIRASTGGRKKMRVLIMTPGFTDTVSVVAAITNHPAPDVRDVLKIGAVTACVDPLNAFMEHRMTFPLLLDQCAQGWVNNILLTSCTEGPHLEIIFIQDLLRKVNSDMAFILANFGEISRSTDAELILSETAFAEPSKVKARHLMDPRWNLPDFARHPPSPSMAEVGLRFSQPLDKSRLLSKIRTLKSSLVPSPFQGNIYHIEARTRFTDSEQLMDLTFTTLSGHLTETPAPEVPVARPPGTPRAPLPPGAATNGPASGDNNGTDAHQYCFVFTGCGLEEKVLKEWLRACAKQKPAPKALKTKMNLTRSEKQHVHETHHLDPLPAGWFYNGSQYVSMSGEKTNTHPEMERYISDFIEESNVKIKEYNDKIAAEDYRDLFD
ncbi:dynein axonemal assembly factor 9-like [Diadema antillarum]|uniref:dynein axonemal assembly factor 9-like n=1 Tax=Diadema antillarum TaxID=105358 RepID=UPI003A8B398E